MGNPSRGNSPPVSATEHRIRSAFHVGQILDRRLRSSAQLHTTAALPGIRLAAGFPDLHPGKGVAVGAAFVSEGVFYPALAGNDIGCAMSFWATDLNARKLKLDRWAKKIVGLDRPWEGDLAGWRERFGLAEEAPAMSCWKHASGMALALSAGAITLPSCRWWTTLARCDRFCRARAGQERGSAADPLRQPRSRAGRLSRVDR